MRRVQLALIEREDFDILYERAEAESSLIGRVFWWTPRAVLICEFLDLRSQFLLWSCNTSLCVDAIEIQLTLNCIALNLPAEYPTRVPTPPLEESALVWN